MPATPPPALQPQLSRAVRILSSRRRIYVVRFGVRFEAAVLTNRSSLRAELRINGRRAGTLRRTGLSRGRVKLRIRLSRSGRARLDRLLRTRGRVQAELRVTTGGQTRRARFTIRR